MRRLKEKTTIRRKIKVHIIVKQIKSFLIKKIIKIVKDTIIENYKEMQLSQISVFQIVNEITQTIKMLVKIHNLRSKAQESPKIVKI